MPRPEYVSEFLIQDTSSASDRPHSCSIIHARTMRIGVRSAVVKRHHFRPARVTACLVVCIPHELDYYVHRFDVLKLCLRSLAANTPRDRYDLMVLDNGSRPEVVDYLRTLQTRGDIDGLILLHRNIGKLNAWRMLFEAAPGDLVSYSDDDVFFEPGWLDAQLDILDSFPRVGMVSARPVRKQFAYGGESLPAYVEQFPGVTLSRGHFIPDDWELEFLRSTGRSAAGLESLKESRTDVLLEYHGRKAYATATHFQFIAPKSIFLEGLRLSAGRKQGSEERRVEESIDALGYVRLSTCGRFVRHIGNVISPELLDEVGRHLAAANDLDVWSPPSPLLERLIGLRAARGFLRRLNRWSYLLLHHPAR
jgi:glycosyltransferase involved in cell wall biosynthesis